MSAVQSNLSDPKFGYDLVVAVTQKSVNATMKLFMLNMQSTEVVACYVYDANNNLVPIDYATLVKNAKGSDPFAVADGADPNTDQDLINLGNANFAGAVKAAIGLPDLPLNNVPPIVTLTSGTNAPVLYNLLCSEFQIAGFVYGARGHASWINKSQPSGQTGDPWYFSANVQLNHAPVDTHDPKLTNAVKDRINALPEGQFSVQQLLVDLDSALLAAAPTIEGVPPGWAVWSLISQVFTGAYFAQMKANGTPVLGYTFSMNQPDPGTLQLGALTFECGALLDSSGNPIVSPTIDQQNAAVLEYLGTTSTNPPTAVEFPWNWVEIGDVSAYSGVQAVRRDVFINFLAGLMNQDVGSLCQATTVSLTHSGETYYISYWSAQAGDAAQFQTVPIGSPGSDGYTEVLSLSYSHTSHDDSEAADHMTSIHGDFNYTVTGNVAFNGNLIKVVLNPQAYMYFGHHELGVNYDDLPGKNYYDKTRTIVYQMLADTKGALTVSVTSDNTVDNSVAWDFDPKGIIGKLTDELDNVKKGLTDVEQYLANLLDSLFSHYASNLTDEINGYHGWVFPGADTFFFKSLQFATSLDLVTQITYGNPS